ncbi:MAG: helix-turn-helix domain-containing protein [Zoogloeaceae bacterium]|jgi:transposase|nr:helix-turn-helix domain-containing protein [Zoogloeaceae bacterium]
MAVERVRKGESAARVIAAYGFNRTTVYKWLKAIKQPGLGMRALRSRKAPGRPRRLSSWQEKQVLRWVNGHDPRQYGLDFGLWTRVARLEGIRDVFEEDQA